MKREHQENRNENKNNTKIHEFKYICKKENKFKYFAMHILSTYTYVYTANACEKLYINENGT